MVPIWLLLVEQSVCVCVCVCVCNRFFFVFFLWKERKKKRGGKRRRIIHVLNMCTDKLLSVSVKGCNVQL